MSSIPLFELTSVAMACRRQLSFYAQIMDGRFETLDEIRLRKANVLAICGFCDHSGIINGTVLWRWFAIHRWDNRIDDVLEHMRCSVCRRRPTKLEATADQPTILFGPEDETGWQKVVARSKRPAAPREPEW